MPFEPRDAASSDAPSELDQLKQQQIESYKELYAAQATRRQLPWSRLRTHQEMGQIDRVIAMVGGDLGGMSVLTVCSGQGVECSHLASAGARVTATDLSPDSVKRLAEACPDVDARQADAENLPFEDGSFDIVFVRRGLHHLPRPVLGIYEMVRVARRHVILLEAQDNWLTRRLTGGRLFGLIPHGGRIECHGNYIYRFSRRELKKLAAAMFLKRVRFHAEWHHNNYVVEGLHHRFCQGSLGFLLGKAFYGCVNAVIGRWGNNLSVVIDKI
ncbi:MAG: class I SAM-dependent methyltransferase [Planctomycetota bacterium]|jgi:ubiquinone/menaquinone biosynthesis C-methylase UbiE